MLYNDCLCGTGENESDNNATLKQKWVHQRGLKISFISMAILFCSLLVAYVLVPSHLKPEQETQPASSTSDKTGAALQRQWGYPNSTTAEHNLPYLPGKVFGRDEELVDLPRLLLDTNAANVVIYGPPAVGKSTLAIHVGYELVKQGVDVRYINVEESSEFREAHEHTTWSRDLNIPSAHSAESMPENQLATRSSEISFSVNENRESLHSPDLLTWAKNLKKETLLILDNSDFLVHRKNKTLLALGSASSKLRVLVTCQRNLRLIGFKRFPLRYLDDNSAITLLRHELSHIHLSDEHCRTICEQVDKSPLALKIAANVISEDMSIPEFISELRKSPMKTLNADVGLPANSTLLAVLSTAYRRLSSKAKLCGQYTSFFSGSFDSVVGKTMFKMLVPSVDSCLSLLFERSLIDSYHLADYKRYRFHRLIRAFFHYQSISHFKAGTIESMVQRFNRTLIHCYTELFADVASKCRNSCADREIASFEYEDHNFWKVVHATKYLCKKKFISAASLANWTTVLTSGNVISVIMTTKERIDMTNEILKCMDRNARGKLRADHILDMYASLITFARETGLRGDLCEHVCNHILHSESRSKLLDALYSASTKTHITDKYKQLKFITTHLHPQCRECMEWHVYAISRISGVLLFSYIVLLTPSMTGLKYVVSYGIFIQISVHIIEWDNTHLHHFLTAIALSTTILIAISAHKSPTLMKFARNVHKDCNRALFLLYLVTITTLLSYGFAFVTSMAILDYVLVERYGQLFVMAKMLVYVAMAFNILWFSEKFKTFLFCRCNMFSSRVSYFMMFIHFLLSALHVFMMIIDQ